MAWNQPGCDGQDRDPWGGKKNTNGSSTNNEGGSDKRSPNFDDLFHHLRNKMSKLVSGSEKNLNHDYGRKKNSGSKRKIDGLIGTIILGIAGMIWSISGLYTIKEAERGVITRFGKFSHLVTPGLNWKPTFIDEVKAVNVEAVRELSASGTMLTSDENVVRVEMNVQYRITNPERYLFSVSDADDSLRQATDSALRGVIGRLTMDRILTEGRTVVRSQTQSELEDTISSYDMGITLLDVNFQTARPPEDVKAAFDDAIAARENREQVVREAEAYANDKLPRARGDAQGILEQARAYKARITLEAQGEVDSFARILPEYRAAPSITRERLYIETMERILRHSHKVLINDQGRNLMVLPIDQLIKRKIVTLNNGAKINKGSEMNHIAPVVSNRSKENHHKDIIEQRREYAQRSNILNEGRD
ncbi:FtsH protease activity modulator HflK [Candidatus Erwinia haradaeae]|uniref:Protein HflK n=1 Tax=Candidatus Erwinia haradaeae TaxID=1922217 RepID=A0A451D8Q8_9GAMM|nr:FtsH protease activity modulator HflK [Candidatus Erwinia haradaeae]VFP82084.1 Modulator of FtsH protease HflK [Candidatus Erwinia haradaeae]